MAKKKKSSRRIVLLVIVAFSVFLFALPRRWTDPPRLWFVSFLSPAQRFVTACLRPIDENARFLARIWHAEREAQEMEKEVQRLRIQNARLTSQTRMLRRQFSSLSILDNLHRAEHLKGVSADVVGIDISEQRDTIIIDAGKAQSVRRDLPVMWEDAAVGRITAVGPKSSRVTLLTDPRCRTRVIISRTGEEGILEGMGNKKCRVKYVSFKSDAHIGDTVVTSGRDGVFPRYVVVGSITSAKRRPGQLLMEIEVTPFLELSAVQNVFVVTQMPKYEDGI